MYPLAALLLAPEASLLVHQGLKGRLTPALDGRLTCLTLSMPWSVCECLGAAVTSGPTLGAHSRAGFGGPSSPRCSCGCRHRGDLPQLLTVTSVCFPRCRARRIKLCNFSDTCSGFQTYHGGPADWAVRCEPCGEASSTWADRAQAALSAGHLCPVLHIVGAQ